MSTVEKVLGVVASDKGIAVIGAVSFLVAFVAMQGWVPVVVGSIALGALGGLALLPFGRSSTIQRETVKEEKIVPYNEWPDVCYGCGQTLGSVRGQLAIHKSEDKNATKAVGLCEECTRTHSTLLDYSETVHEALDRRDNPEQVE